MRFDAQTWREMERQARNSGWETVTHEQVIDLWERSSGYNWLRYCLRARLASRSRSCSEQAG